MSESIVYKIESPSGKYYIGSTNNLQRRLREHTEGTKNPHCLYIESAYKKYGEDRMILSILARCESREDAYSIEQDYLNTHFDDDLCMNLKSNAKGFSTEQAKKANAARKNPFDIAAYMRGHPEKRIRKPKKKEKEKKVNPSNIKEAKLILTTREYKEWYKDNKPFVYALKNPQQEIVYVKKGGLQCFCKENNLCYCTIQKRKYNKGWFLTKDLSKEGIEKLRDSTTSISKGNSKKVKIYYDGNYLITTDNLKKWCIENNFNYNIAGNIARGTRKSSYKKHKFKYVD